MNWLDKKNWKDCLVATFLCLFGCSIGTIGILFFLADYNWLFVLLFSLVIGMLAAILFIALWNIVFLQINFKDAIRKGFKMSIVSMLIISGTENLIMLILHPQNSAHGITGNYSDDLFMMLIAMSTGFLFALPYNYYTLAKTGKVCH
jgi:hypothetical protein